MKMKNKFQEKKFFLPPSIGIKKDSKTNLILWYMKISNTEDRNLISGSRDYDVRIWNEKKCVRILSGHKSDITCIRLFDNDQKLISSSSDAKIKVHTLNNNYECIKTFCDHSAAIYTFLFFENDKLISCSDDKSIRVWDLSKNECIKTLEGHSDYVLSLLLLEKTQHLASCSNDSTIKIWKLNGEMNCERTLKGHTMGVRNALLNPKKSNQIISCSWDCSIKIWDYLLGNCIMTLTGHTKAVRNILLSNQGNLISYGFDQTLRVWEIKSGECLFILKGHNHLINCCLLLSQNELISSDDKAIKFWDLLNGRCLRTIKIGANCLLLDDTTNSLLIGTKSGTIMSLNLSNGACIYSLKGHLSSVDRLLWRI